MQAISHPTLSELHRGKAVVRLLSFTAVAVILIAAFLVAMATSAHAQIVQPTINNLSQSSYGINKAGITWDASDPNSLITGYSYSADNGVTWTSIAGGASATSATVTGLTGSASLLYDLKLRASTTSGPEPTADITVYIAPPTVTNLAAQAGDGQITVTWDPASVSLEQFTVRIRVNLPPKLRVSSTA